MEELTKVSHKLAEEIYKNASAKGQQQAPGAGPQGPGAGPQQEPPTEDETAGAKKDDVIDAEFTKEDDNKKGKK